MTTTYRANSNLRTPAYNDASWNIPNDANFGDLDASPMYGLVMCSLAEVPSASLNVKVSAGAYVKADGTVQAFAGLATLTLAASATNYVHLTDAGAVAVSTTGWPAAPHVRLAVAVTGGTAVTGLTDARVPLRSAGVTVYLALAGGAFADGAGVVAVHTGTAHGTQVGGTAAELLGFWGAAPVAQPSGAAQADAGALTVQALADSTGGSASTTLAAVAAGASYAQADMVAVRDALAALAAQVNHIAADLAATRTLADALRAGLVAAGLIKGSA